MITTAGWKEIEVAKMVSADWNYKKEDEDTAAKLIANIKRNGQIENILVRLLDTGYYEVINGNHRLAAFKALDIEKAICFDFGKISDAKAHRIAIETNETRFESDGLKLAGLVKEMLGEEFEMGELAETMPFSESELEAMSKLTDFDWDQFGGAPEEDPAQEEEAPPPALITCPECGHEFEQK